MGEQHSIAVALAIVACASCGGSSVLVDGSTASGTSTSTSSTTTSTSSSGATESCPGESSDGPVELTKTTFEATGIAADGKNVYWIQSGLGQTVEVYKCSVCGCKGGPTRLAHVDTPQGQPGSIAVDAKNVYWTLASVDNVHMTNGGAVMKCAIEGCDDHPTFLASGQAPTAIAVDAKNVYWTNAAQSGLDAGAVMKCAIDGCGGNATVVVGSQYSPKGIAVDAKNVYWTTWAGNLVLQCGLQGCPDGPVTLASLAPLLGMPTSIAVDASSVYWVTDQSYASDDQLMKCAIGGCGQNPTVLASNLSTPGNLFSGGMVVDGANVYFTNATQLGLGGDGQLMRCATGGCDGAPALVASKIDEPGPIAADATSIYTRSGASIVKVPK